VVDAKTILNGAAQSGAWESEATASSSSAFRSLNYADFQRAKAPAYFSLRIAPRPRLHDRKTVLK
jgi:hypothetical protein